MGEILEEVDKDDEEKKDAGEGQEGTEKTTTERKEGGSEDAAAIKEVCVCVNNLLVYGFYMIYEQFCRGGEW